MTTAFDESVECTIHLPQLEFDLDTAKLSTLIQAILGIVLCFNRPDLSKTTNPAPLEEKTRNLVVESSRTFNDRHSSEKERGSQNTRESIHPDLNINLKISRFSGKFTSFEVLMTNLLFSKIAPSYLPDWVHIFQLQLESLTISQKEFHLLQLNPEPFKHKLDFHSIHIDPKTKEEYRNPMQCVEMVATLRTQNITKTEQKLNLSLNLNSLYIHLPPDDSVLSIVLEIVELIVNAPYQRKNLELKRQSNKRARSLKTNKPDPYLPKLPFQVMFQVLWFLFILLLPHFSHIF